jgi:hypothetical protein
MKRKNKKDVITIMTKKWGCPICEQTSSRNWNMRRHIQRKHNVLVQPIDLLKVSEYQYQNRRDVILNEECNCLQSGGFSPSIPAYYQDYYQHHQLLRSYSNYKMQRYKQQEQEQHRDKENTPFSTDSTEKIFLQPLRQLREFKQLIYDVFLDPRWTSRYYYYQPFNTISNNNNNSCWSGSKGIVDSSLEPRKDKLHDLRLIAAERINDILHNNKNKIDSTVLQKSY